MQRAMMEDADEGEAEEGGRQQGPKLRVRMEMVNQPGVEGRGRGREEGKGGCCDGWRSRRVGCQTKF